MVFGFHKFSVILINRSRSAMLMQGWHCAHLIADFSVETRNAEIREVGCWMSIIIKVALRSKIAKLLWLGGVAKDMVWGMKKARPKENN